MYRNIDECLRDVYRFGALRIEPMGNTAQICEWIKAKGVTGGTGSLTQAEWHANAAMIRSQISGCLNSPLLVAVVECQYGKLDGLMIIAGVLAAEKICADVYLVVDMLRHIYSEMPRRVAIMDKYDLPNMTFTRRRERISNYLANWERVARFKLQECFREKGIIEH